MPTILGESAHLVLFFGSASTLADAEKFHTLRELFPQAILMGCSTAGEICGTRIFEDSLVVTAIAFEHTRLELVHSVVSMEAGSRSAGMALAQSLDHEDLTYVLLLSDGLNVNGCDLAAGLRESLPEGVIVTGGLAGDGCLFQRTLLSADAEATDGIVAAVGFYGNRLKVGFGSLGGWDPFGPERVITDSNANILKSLDGQSALALYKTYLGEHAAGLPATALLFPLELRMEEGAHRVVRTVLGVDEASQSMIFAGNMPEGAYARFMKTNFDRLVGGAVGAAMQAASDFEESGGAELALLISCVGRKLILKQRTEEEIEGVRDILGPQAVLTGFYSYGEICPVAPNAGCELHNQTMTITTFREV